MKKKPFVSPSFLKQKARQLKREKSLSQKDALDEASKHFGFSNYKNYLNFLVANQPKPATEEQLVEIRLQKRNEMSEKYNHTNSLTQSFKLSFRDLLETLKQAQHSEETIQSICEGKVAIKEFIELHLLKDFLQDESGEIDMYAPYHIAEEVSAMNLIYKLNDDKLRVEGDYDLKLGFAFDHGPNNDKDDFFDDQVMFGTFELTIDRDRQVTFDDQTIGHSL